MTFTIHFMPILSALFWMVLGGGIVGIAAVFFVGNMLEGMWR